MKKIIKLTEQDLRNIVERVIFEQSSTPSLKKGDSGVEVKKYQRALISLGFDLGPRRDDGIFGTKTQNAVAELQRRMKLPATGVIDQQTKNYLSSQTIPGLGQKPQAPKPGETKAAPKPGETKVVSKPGETKSVDKSKIKKGSGFIIIFAFPAYKPSLDKGDAFSEGYAKVVEFFTGNKPQKFPPMGHGGCVVINSDGNCTLYEFGRYEGHGKGMGLVKSKNLGNIAKINNGVLENAQKVAEIAKKNTQGEGPKLAMTAVSFKLPNPSGAQSYASVKQRKYQILDMDADDEESNCGTFALKVAQAGGVDVPEYCFPMPSAMVQQLRMDADDYFTV